MYQQDPAALVPRPAELPADTDRAGKDDQVVTDQASVVSDQASRADAPGDHVDRPEDLHLWHADASHGPRPEDDQASRADAASDPADRPDDLGMEHADASHGPRPEDEVLGSSTPHPSDQPPSDQPPSDQRPEPSASSGSSSAEQPSDSDAERRELETRWQLVQASFVDDPGQAIRAADTMIAETLRQAMKALDAERETIARVWHDDDGGDPASSTEEYRLALRRYRDLFRRLLTV